MSYLFWKGKDSRLINNLIILELPPISKPRMRTKTEQIDGKDGSIITDLGFESYDKIVKIGLKDNYNLDKLIGWFNGEGLLCLSNEPDKYYKAKIIEQIDYQRLIRFKTANIKFNVQPFKYSAIERLKTFDIDAITTSINIINSGNVEAKPLITFYGTGVINVSLNGIQIFTLDLSSDGNITLDCDKQEAFKGLTLKNRKMDGDFLKLIIGKNILSFTSGLTKIEILNYSRWL